MSSRRSWSKIDLDEIVPVELSDEERDLLWEGLHQWGGPTRPTDAVAQVIGFEDVVTMRQEMRRIREALRSRTDVSKRDWQRAIIALEMVWSSNFYGAAGDWEIVAAGWDDDRTLRVLRGLQRNFAGLRAPWRNVATSNDST